jgi:hypothetical protein
MLPVHETEKNIIKTVIHIGFRVVCMFVFRKLKCKSENNIRVDIKEMGFDGVDR